MSKYTYKEVFQSRIAISEDKSYYRPSRPGKQKNERKLLYHLIKSEIHCKRAKSCTIQREERGEAKAEFANMSSNSSLVVGKNIRIAFISLFSSQFLSFDFISSIALFCISNTSDEHDFSTDILVIAANFAQCLCHHYSCATTQSKTYVIVHISSQFTWFYSKASQVLLRIWLLTPQC